MNKLLELSTTELSNLISSKKISCEELVSESIQNIKENDSKINSFITILDKEALQKAKDLDNKLSKKEIEHSFLTGIPIMLKDNIATKGIKTTAGSKILENYISPYDSFVTKKF